MYCKCLLATTIVLSQLGHSPLHAQDKKGQKLALLVGVRDYDHPEMRPLRYSENDVVELGKVLKGAGYDVTLLADGVGEKTAALTPSRANIEKHLAEILAKCKRREDAILIAFAGHGIQPEGDKDAYFCPKDANPKVDPKKSMVSLNKLYAALEESFAGVKVVLVDACRDDPKLARGRTGITGDSAPRPPRGVAVLFSCAAGEIAYEHEKYKHGVFFHHVLEGLRGKAKDDEDEVTFTSLASYVSRAVARDVPRLIGEGAQQSPNLKADLAGAPPVLTYVKRVELPPEKKLTLPVDPPIATEADRRKLDELRTMSVDNIFKWCDAAKSDAEGLKRLVAISAGMERDKTLIVSPMGYDALGASARNLNQPAIAEMFFRRGRELAQKTGAKHELSLLTIALHGSLTNSKRYAEAVELCRTSMPLLDPGGQDFQTYLLVQTLGKQGKLDEALRLSEELASRYEWGAQSSRFSALLDAGRYDEAVTHEEKKLKDGKPEDRHFAMSILSDYYERAGKVDMAAELLQKLIDIDPDQEQVGWHHLRLGKLWASNGRNLVAAEKHVLVALQQARARVEDKKEIFVPGSIYAVLGLVCLRQERFKEAKDHLIQALNDPYEKYQLYTYHHLGDAELALGNRESAVAAWREGLRLNREDFTHEVIQLRKVMEAKIEKQMAEPKRALETPLPTPPIDTAADEAKVLNLINKERAKKSLPLLRSHVKLEQVARELALELARDGEVKTSFAERLGAVGYMTTFAAQDKGMLPPESSWEELVSKWVATKFSPALNFLDTIGPNEEIGIGVAIDGLRRRHVVMIFTKPR